MPEYRELREEEISTGLFRHFIRRQEVGKCWRRERGMENKGRPVCGRLDAGRL